MKRFCCLGLLLLAIPLFQGCQAAHAMASPGPRVEPHPFELTETLDQVIAKTDQTAREVDGLKQAIDDLRADVDGISQRLDNPTETVSEQVTSLTDQLKIVAGQQCDLTEQLASISPRSAGESADPPLIDESQVDRGPVVDAITDSTGQTWDLQAFIRDNYKRAWTWQGDLDEHLAKTHGVDLQTDLDSNTKQKLHAAIHERELALAEPTPLAGVTSDCPDGKCPLRSRAVTVTKPGVSRSVSSQTYSTPATVSGSYFPQTVRTWSYSSNRPVSKAASRRAARCAGPNCCR